MATQKRPPSFAAHTTLQLLPKHRLFTVIAGPADEAVRDPQLRKWTDDATQALRHLFAAARLEGRFELVHQAVGAHRHIHVDSKSKLLRAEDLFELDTGTELSPAEAGDRLMRQARTELVQLIKMKQGVALQELVNAAARLRVTTNELHGHLTQMVKGSRGGRMEVQTHSGEYVLMYRVADMDVADEAIEIEGEVYRAGKDHVLIRPKKAYRTLHDWLRPSEKVRFAESVSLKRQMTRLYRRGVQEGGTVRIVAKRYYSGVSKRRRGLFVEAPWTVVP